MIKRSHDHHRIGNNLLVVLAFICFLVPSLLNADELSIQNVNTLLDGNALYKHYCQVCHGEKGDGNGPNAVNVVPPPADFTDIELMMDRTDKKLFKIIERGGRGAALSKNMPPWGNTLSENQIWSLVGYVRKFSKTTGQSTFDVRSISASLSGESSSDRCSVCHPTVLRRNIIAPDLGYERTKFTRNWLIGFLKNPIKIRPVGYMPFTKSRMPNFQFSDLDAEAIAEYLLHRDESASEDELLSQSGNIDLSPIAAKKGRKLFRRLGCAACHTIDGKGGAVGPNLSKSAHRLKPYWMFKWLKNPQAIRPDAPMPNYALEDDKVKVLVAYLMQLKDESPFPVTPITTRSGLGKEQLYAKGELLVQQKNCLGCHYMHSGNDRGYEIEDSGDAPLVSMAESVE